MASRVPPKRMSGMHWKFNRLRAMSFQELVHRTGRTVQQYKERISQAVGHCPKPCGSVGPGLSLFATSDNWLTEWEKNFSIDRESLFRIMEGKIAFFGLSAIDVGNPVEWHCDPSTRMRTPLHYGKTLDYRDTALVGNIKMLWELGRHQHLIPLAVAYAVTGEQHYRSFVLRQVLHWIHANPFGKGIHWCSSLEVALRLISWAFIHSLLVLRDGPEGLFREEQLKKELGLSIYHHAWFIRCNLSLYSSANNHLIGELTGLLVATQVFDWGTECTQWSLFAKATLERQAMVQVHSDGVNKEQALYYHLWVLEYFLLAWLVGERTEDRFSDDFRRTILRMSQFLCDVTPDGGLPPQIGDSDDGTVARFEATWPKSPYLDVLSSVSGIFDQRPDRGPVRSTEKAFWYERILPTERRRREEPTLSSGQDNMWPVLYPHGGYSILKQGVLHALFDVGPLGYTSLAAHGHADSLSFCLAIETDWWIVDPGTFCYHDQPKWRNYFRGTSSHNTIVVDHQNQSVIGGPFLWAKHANSHLERCEIDRDGNQVVEGWHDGYRQVGITHRRKISLHHRSEELHIVDSIEGTGVHELAIHFHFAPTVRVHTSGTAGRWEIEKLHSPYHVSFNSSPAWDWEAIKGDDSTPLGWFSENLGIKEPAYTLRGQCRGHLPLTVESRFNVMRC